ncbi:toxin glutamine deamidase domain-containing protein [Streptomyces sp. NPDC003753]
MTAIPIHTPVHAPSVSASPSHSAGPATPHHPGSPQATPGTPNHQQHPQQDSLEDIRSDLDHYPGGLSEPDPADQQALVDAVPHNEDGTPQRFPDPFGHWSQLQNDGGNTVPGRSNNCADCSRSFLETWYGNPQVSAPRTLDTDEHGNPDVWSPENNANDNQIRWTGAAHTYAGPGGDPDTANNIANTLQQAGHGSAAIVQVDWPGGGGHAFNAVNHHGDIVWIDTQTGQVSHDPIHIDNAEHVWHIPLDADRNPIHPAQPDTDTSHQETDTHQEGADASHQDPDNSSQANGSPEATEPNPSDGTPDNVPGKTPDHPETTPTAEKEPSLTTPDGHTEDSPTHADTPKSEETSTGRPSDSTHRPDANPTHTSGGSRDGNASDREPLARHGAPETNSGTPTEDRTTHSGRTTDTAPEQHTSSPTSRPGDTPSSPAGTDHVKPEDPAGAQPGADSSDPWHDEGDGIDDGEHSAAPPESSSPYEEKQPENHQHYGMLGDQAQRDLRDRDVHQIDQERVHDYLETLANNHNDQLRHLLEGSENGTTWRRSDLMQLPGFGDLTRGQQLATVAVLARLSIHFHTNQGVGASPYAREGENSAYKWREDAEREPLRQRDVLRQKNYDGVDNHNSSRAAGVRAKSDFSNVEGSDNKSSTPAQRTRHYLDEKYGESVAEQVVAATSDMKPDFSGRNFAVIEVFDPHTQQTHYVADSSFSHAGPRPAHSEPHIGGWIERLNEDRAAQGQKPLDVLHMYTEREPCGHPSESPGHADCSGYILKYLPKDMPVSYATGYRKGEQVVPFTDPKGREGVNTPRQAMDADFQHHLNRVADILKAYAVPAPASDS